MEVTCPICNRLIIDVLIKDVNEFDNTYDVFYCRECNTGVTIPVPSLNTSSSLYSLESYRSASGKRFIGPVEAGVYLARQLRRRRIQKYKKPGRILDIGCGRGVFLNVMKKTGWNVAGTEHDWITADAIANRYDIHIAAGNPGEWGFPTGSFDVVTMYHVLEHMSDPESAIGECSRILEKGGLLVVATPNIRSIQSSLGARLWFHLDIPYHLYHFSEQGLSSLIEKFGFHVFKVRRFSLEYCPFGWLQTLLNLTGIRKNLLYNILKNTNSRKSLIFNASKWDILLTISLTPLFLPISLILSLYESFMLKKGGTIEIYARKS